MSRFETSRVLNVTVTAGDTADPDHDAPPTGGALEVEVLGGTTEPVLAVHGVSSNRRLWDWLRAVDPGIAVIAPDLRGRGGSVGVSGTSALQQHVDDMLRVLDACELESAHVCGMSMGGFVAVELATAAPDRVRSLTLVDGGLPMARPEGLTREMIPAAFAGQTARAERLWSGVDEYLELFAESSPLLDAGDPLLRDNLAHDLVAVPDDREGAGFRVRLAVDALLADAEDVFFGETHWEQLDVPTRLLAAEWSVGAGSPPAYSDDALARFAEQLPCLVEIRRVPGTDHGSSIMTRDGAAVVAELLRANLATG